MQNKLTKQEAVEFLALDEKTFDNFFKSAGEFPALDRNGNRGRYLFDEGVLRKWKEGFEWRTIELNVDDYALCLDFALAQHFRGYVLSDWGTARQREFGQKITNWVKGQLAEVAVKKFFKKEFGAEIELDFQIHEEIVPQDIIGIKEDGKTREPQLKVGIKSSKPKSAYLVLGENEVALANRRSDIYIFCRPDIPDDHLLRITREEIVKVVKSQPHFPTYKAKIPSFENIPCEIAGWCRIDELERVDRIPGQVFDGFRHVRKTGLLRRNKKDWEELIKLL